MKHKVKVEVTGYVTSVFVQLEEFEITLAYDGDKTYRATKEIEVHGALDLVFKVRGWNGTGWTVTIAVDNAAVPVFGREGTIEEKNYSLLTESITLA